MLIVGIYKTCQTNSDHFAKPGVNWPIRFSEVKKVLLRNFVQEYVLRYFVKTYQIV